MGIAVRAPGVRDDKAPRFPTGQAPEVHRRQPVMPAEPERRRLIGGWQYGSVLAGLGWLALGCAALAVDSLLATEDRRFHATVFLGVLAMFFGLWAFWRDGGSRITAVGTYNFGFALFVGFAAAYQAVKTGSGMPDVPLFRAVALCYFVNVLTWLFFWSRRSSAPQARATVAVDPSAARWAVWSGAALLTLAVVLTLSLPPQYQHLLVNSAGFVGVVLLGVGLLRTTDRKPPLVYGVVPAAGFAIYYTYLFHTFGRIVLGSLGLALAAILADRSGHRRIVKSTVLLVAAPTISVLGWIRAAPAALGGDPSVADSDGLMSMVGPFHNFAQLLSLNDLGLLPKVWGDTFYAAAVTLVPRVIWPDKPRGLGAELVAYLHPELTGTGHSDAALFSGEWLYNFGLAGLLLMIPVTGLAVRGIDRVVQRIAAKPVAPRQAIFGYVVGVVMVVGFFDMIWVGTATFAARTGCRLLVLAAVFVVGVWGRRASGNPAGSGPPSGGGGQDPSRAGPAEVAGAVRRGQETT